MKVNCTLHLLLTQLSKRDSACQNPVFFSVFVIEFNVQTVHSIETHTDTHTLVLQLSVH